MSATKSHTRTAAVKDKAAGRRRLRLRCTLNTEASDHFRALPLKEREHILADFRAACAPAFASVDDYLAEKRRERARDADA